MLTLEETGWSLKAFKTTSILNILPIGVDVKSGKIQRQSNKVKVCIWKIIFGVGVSHWIYMFVRLVQSTILDPQKYFKWDHFVLHFGLTSCYAIVYFIGYRVFVKSPEENVMIFNQVFAQREDPVQKMMDQQLQMNPQCRKRNGNGNRVSAPGNEKRGKSGTGLVSSSRGEPHEEIAMEVIENLSQFKFEPEVCARPLLTWPPQYSLDELIAKLLPLAAGFSEALVILILALDPTRPQLLYSVLPPEWRNVWTFSILLAVEALCMTIIFFTGSFAVVSQVLFFGKCQLECQRMSLQLRNLEKKFQNGWLWARQIERENWILRQILKEMRELVVLIELFNRCYPFCIFAWKIWALSISILFYFFAIRHFEDFPALAVFIGYCAIVATCLYTILYGHAFSIPEKMDELKHEFLLTAQKTTSNSNFNGNKNFRAEVKKEMKRIRRVGIKVGSFHQMERESTPRFVDFVFRNVVTLLVTFPR